MKEIIERDKQWRIANHRTDPLQTFRKLLEEVSELDEALQTGNRLEIGSELADIAIVVIGIMGLYDFDVEALLNAKLSRNEVKYARTQELINQGMTVEEAFRLQKEEWDVLRDYQFLEGL